MPGRCKTCILEERLLRWLTQHFNNANYHIFKIKEGLNMKKGSKKTGNELEKFLKKNAWH